MLLPLFLYPLNFTPQRPVAYVPLHIHVPSRAEGVIRCTFGVALPISPDLRFPNGRSAGADGFFHGLPAVAVGAQPQGDHGVHA